MVFYDQGTGSTSSGTWVMWNSDATSTATTGSVWGQWVSTGGSLATQTSSTSQVVWSVWQDGRQVAIQDFRRAEYAPPPPPTQEQLDAEEARRVEAEAKRKEAERKEKLARQRAKKLLLKNLSLEQKLAYTRTKKFRVQARSGTLYELRHGWAANVDELGKDEKPVRRFCIHPRFKIPEADNLLAQKLMIETDEELFRKTANITPVGVN